MEIKTVVTDNDILKCWDVLYALRPHLNKENFISDVKKTLEDNRQLIFIEEDGIAVAASVFEWGYNLYRGKYIYIDDLSTLPKARSRSPSFPSMGRKPLLRSSDRTNFAARDA